MTEEEAKATAHEIVQGVISEAGEETWISDSHWPGQILREGIAVALLSASRKATEEAAKVADEQPDCHGGCAAAIRKHGGTA